MPTPALLQLILVAALAVPLREAGPARTFAPEVCVQGGAVRPALGPGAKGETQAGGQAIASLEAAGSGPAEGASGPTKGPRRDLTVAPRRVPTMPAVFSTSPPPRDILVRESSIAPEHSGITAHPSTAPPRDT